MNKQETAYVIASDGRKIYGTGTTLPAAVRAAEQARKNYEAVTKRGGK